VVNEFQRNCLLEGLDDIGLTLRHEDAIKAYETALIESAVAVIEGAKLLIPNAFSPGRDGPGSGDGKNDTFIPLMRGVVEFQMTVFNRWGELLFETRDAEDGWNGYYKGKLCQQDVYVYKIVAKYGNGDTITKVGDIHLIR
jgi:gliding motility-associated-like protein